MLQTLKTSFFTILSIVLVLLLLGFYGIIGLHAGSLTNILKENINLIVVLEDDVLDAERQEVISSLEADNRIIKESIKYYSSEDALIIMQNEMGDSLLISGNENPFQEMITFNVKYEFVSVDELNKLVESVEENQHVFKVNYYESVYEYLGKNVSRLSRVLLFLGIFLLLFSFALIYSTIQLKMFAERFKIRTMELVGADYKQIRKPFILLSLRIALISVILAVFLMIVMLIITWSQFNYFNEVINYSYIILIVVMMFAAAVGITQLASHMVVQSYLGAEKKKFY